MACSCECQCECLCLAANTSLIPISTVVCSVPDINTITTSSCCRERQRIPPSLALHPAHNLLKAFYSIMTKLSILSVALAVAVVTSCCSAFAPPSPAFARHASRLFEEKKDSTEAVFVPPTEEKEEEDKEIPLEAAESLGRGSAKVRNI